MPNGILALAERYVHDSYWEYEEKVNDEPLIKQLYAESRPFLAQGFVAEFEKKHFHDDEILGFQVKPSKRLVLDVLSYRGNEKYQLIFSDLSILHFHGWIMIPNYYCPGPRRLKIAQIMDIWFEKNQKLHVIIVLDEHRYMRIECAKVTYKSIYKRASKKTSRLDSL